MQYHRFGHALEHFVKLGDKVKKGQKILALGTGNGQWSAHCHYDKPTEKLSSWESYVFGITKDQVKKLYSDPTRDIKTVMPEYDHMGFGYLEYANYGTASKPKYCYHPGVDLNGKGAGNADLGDIIYSPCDGVVVHDDDDGKALNGGWGRLLVIQEVAEESKPEEKPKIEPVATPDITKTEEENKIVISTEEKPQETEKTAVEEITKTEPMQTYAEVDESAQTQAIQIDWKFIWNKILELINLIFKK